MGRIEDTSRIRLSRRAFVFGLVPLSLAACAQTFQGTDCETIPDRTEKKRGDDLGYVTPSDFDKTCKTIDGVENKNFGKTGGLLQQKEAPQAPQSTGEGTTVENNPAESRDFQKEARENLTKMVAETQCGKTPLVADNETAIKAQVVKGVFPGSVEIFKDDNGNPESVAVNCSIAQGYLGDNNGSVVPEDAPEPVEIN